MSQCLRIEIIAKKPVVNQDLQRMAKNLLLEGYAQPTDNSKLHVVVCGEKSKIEAFIDALHEGVLEKKIEQFVIEPFLKDRDYRGVFRFLA